MKKLVVGALALLVSMGIAVADVETYTVDVTNGQAITYSDELPVSGWLDKIIITQDSASTSTVTVATYNGTTAVDTYYTGAITETASGKVVCRPRIMGTTTGAVAIAAVTGTAVGTNTTTMLVANYEKTMIGGPVKCAVTGTANDGTNTVTVRIFYERSAK